MFPKSNPRHGNKNSSILHSTNPKRVVREVDYNPIDGAALALVSSHRESQIKGKLLTDPDSGNRREKIPSAETIASDEEDNDDNGDGSSWPSKVNSGTSFIFEESIFYDSGDDGSNRYNDFYIQCTESHDDSVVSRLTTEEDDMCLRCLECAGRGNGGWMHCLDCYRFHYRA